MYEFINIETKRLNLLPFTERYLTDRYVSWLNDPEVVQFSEQRHCQHSKKSCADYFLEIKRRDHGFYAICEKETGLHIGNSTISIDLNNQIADIQILIGDRSFWGQGLGAEAFSALVEMLLESSCFRKVTAGTLAKNGAMLKTMEKAGMIVECIREGHYLLNGQPVDVIYGARWNNDKVL